MTNRGVGVDAPRFGVDGCRAGWVVASRGKQGKLTFAVVADLVSLLAPLARVPHAVVAIDIPVGLADADARACDDWARTRLGHPRLSSVFSAPCRDALTENDYFRASERNRDLRGKGLSRQLWGIASKIRHVDELLASVPDLAARAWEAHPEVTFAELGGTERGLTASKKSAVGAQQRLTLLRIHGVEVEPSVERVRLGRGVAEDDIVDAAACLLTAERIAEGRARFFPPGAAPVDRRGRRMQIAA